jgi:Ala-tRNA(Pro) deacylase
MSKVTEYLTRMRVPHVELAHANVHTALGEAFALGISPDVVAKPIVLDVGTVHVLAVVPASRTLDIRRIRDALRQQEVRLASETELEHDFPQYELGAFPALGSIESTPVLIDPEVVVHREVFFAAGTSDKSVRVRTRDLLRIEHALVTPIVRSDGADDVNEAA